MRALLRALWRRLPTFPPIDGDGTDDQGATPATRDSVVPNHEGGAQQATPATETGVFTSLAGPENLAYEAPEIAWYPGLGWWADNLATLDPPEIARMLLELEPPPYDPATSLIIRDATADWETLGFPIARIVRVIDLCTVNHFPDSPSSDYEHAIGSFVVFNSSEAAAEAMAAHQVLYYGDYAGWPTSLAGLPGIWIVSDDGDAELIVLAGPVIMVAVESRTQVAQSVSLVLLNAHHLLHHLWVATRDALDID